ncbi:phage baseplate assembly protein V [Bacterioplanoides sp.]|uniref:phage baseplate assembly protein V n=1 Tax=Bacterioplanoides sp. TaxID=2066072 RepID=UPI003B00924E
MEEALLRISKQLDEKRYGKYRAFVVDTADPEKRGRVRLRIPSVLGDAESSWALPCVPFAGGSGYGWFAVPPLDSQLWVEFEEGDINRPIWVGAFWQVSDDVPENAAQDEPTVFLLQTPAGNRLELNDTEGEEALTLFHPSEAQLQIDSNGSCAVTDANGSKLVLDASNNECVIEDSNGNKLVMSSSGTKVEDASGNSIEMASSGITVSGQQIVIEGSQVSLGGQGGEPLIKGTSFLTLFATHIHPTAMGPSGPPIPQGEMSSLSTTVLTS